MNLTIIGIGVPTITRGSDEPVSLLWHTSLIYNCLHDEYPLMMAILDAGQVTGHFESHRDHQRTICTVLAFNWPNSLEIFIYIFAKGSYILTVSTQDDHLEFPIAPHPKKHNFCGGPPQDHPCNICLKLIYRF